MPTRSASKRDYVAQEARNSALGSAGELLVMQYEEYRLRSAGKAGLADRIERVSESRGDGLGYDILSFEPSGKETPFYASRNEISFSEDFRDHFHLYRLFEFRESPKLFSLPGAIGNNCQMDPVSFICSLR